MKIAVHFNADHPSIKTGFYGMPIHKEVFSTLLQYRTLNISSKVFIGDLLLTSLAHDTVTTSYGWQNIFNKEKYFEVINLWLFAGNNIWKKFSQDRIQEAIRCNMFTMCFENIDYNLSEYLHTKLQEFPPYLGSIEVDDTSEIHWELYSHSLSAKYRIINNNLKLFWDGFNEDSKDNGWLEFLKKCGFNTVEFESLEGKYSLFDKYHNYKHARRVAEWRKRSSNLLAFLSDEVVSRLLDTAPDLGNKLWAAYKTFDDAETDEQYAQVTTSCRRIIEYVADSLFPPIDEEHDGRKLKGPHYKNRLLAYADIERRSETNIDVVIASTNLLSEQIDKLVNLVNKGVHTEVYREEARRCLIRTVMLLDDFISLKKDAFKGGAEALTERYNQLSKTLIETFPKIKERYLEEKQWYEDLLNSPHIIFGDLLNPLLVELLIENKNKEEISKIFDFMEKISNYEDVRIQEVVQVTVLERIGDDKQILAASYEYMGSKTRQLSDEIERTLGRS